MKKAFRKQRTFPLGVIGFFLLLAILWYVPLFLSFKKAKIDKLPVKTPIEEPYILLEPTHQWTSDFDHALSDPTIFSLPSDVGFSVYLRKVIVSPKIMLPIPTVPIILQPFEEEKIEEEIAVMDRLMLKSPDPVQIENKSDHSVTEKSFWDVTGPIAERVIQPTVPLPRIEVLEEELEPTVLSVGITPQGDVLFVMLNKSSRSEKADKVAIQFVKNMRFLALNFSRENLVSWGGIRFFWKADKQTFKS